MDTRLPLLSNSFHELIDGNDDQYNKTLINKTSVTFSQHDVTTVE